MIPTQSELAAMRDRCDKATAGEWEITQSRDVFPAVISIGVATIAMDFENIDDAIFVKHSHTDLPRCLDSIEALTRERDACLDFIHNEMKWLVWRAEMLGDGVSQANIGKLKSFLDEQAAIRKKAGG